jgi:hypothetical protein
MQRIKFVIILLLNGLVILAQEKTIPEHITEVAEELASYEAEPFLSEIYAEVLNELYDNKVLINNGDEEEIQRLFFLSGFAVKSLADYVRTTGPVLTLQELAGIPGFNRETAVMMAPFTDFTVAGNRQETNTHLHQSLLSGVMLKPGENDPSYQGSPVRALVKYKFSSGNFSGGFTAEKDPGETLLMENTPVTDFFSFNFCYSSKGFLRRVVIGDYSARFGHGISVNTSIGTGFSLTAPGNLAAKNDIRAYTSSDENNFFRGAAAVLGIKNFEISFLCSSNDIDATLNSYSDTSETTVRNLVTTGYHNSQGTIRGKDVLKETCGGVNLTYSKGNFKSGLSAFSSRYSYPFRPDYSDPENLYDFNGDQYYLYSFYYNTIFRRLILSGEISSSGLINYAFIQTATLRPSDRLSLSFIYRNYSQGFVALHGRGTGSSGETSNGKAVSGSFTFEAFKYLFVSAGCDLRTYDWLRYRASSPSSAKRFEVRIKYLPSEKLNLEALYQVRQSERDGPGRQGIPLQETVSVQSSRISTKYLVNEKLTLASRIDFKWASPGNRNGILMLQDLILKPGNLPLTIWYRYCIYNTDDYETGIYTWENDLLYSFSIPVLYGKGIRNYIMIKMEPSDFAEFRIKYGFTSSTKGSADEEFRDELRLQVCLRF